MTLSLRCRFRKSYYCGLPVPRKKFNTGKNQIHEMENEQFLDRDLACQLFGPDLTVKRPEVNYHWVFFTFELWSSNWPRSGKLKPKDVLLGHVRVR